MVSYFQKDHLVRFHMAMAETMGQLEGPKWPCLQLAVGAGCWLLAYLRLSPHGLLYVAVCAGSQHDSWVAKGIVPRGRKQKLPILLGPGLRSLSLHFCSILLVKAVTGVVNKLN